LLRSLGGWVEGLLETGTIVPVSITKAFESKSAIDKARSKLRNGVDTHLTLGHNVIRAYLGQDNAERSHRGERQIRDAIAALKQSGGFCMPSAGAQDAIPQGNGNCPWSAGESAAKTNRIDQRGQHRRHR
jgi:hypothetical protein